MRNWWDKILSDSIDSAGSLFTMKAMTASDSECSSQDYIGTGQACSTVPWKLWGDIVSVMHNSTDSVQSLNLKQDSNTRVKEKGNVRLKEKCDVGWCIKSASCEGEEKHQGGRAGFFVLVKDYGFPFVFKGNQSRNNKKERQKKKEKKT